MLGARKGFLALVAVCTFAGAAWAASQVAAQLYGTSSIELNWTGDYYDGRKTTTDFNLHGVYSAVTGQRQNVLLKSVIRKALSTGYDTADGHVDIEARIESNGRFDQVAWQLSEDANAVAFDDDRFVVTSKYGCCAALTSNRAYNALTGRLAFAYAAYGERGWGDLIPPYSIEIPNSRGLIRYIGVLTTDATRDFEPETLPNGFIKLATVVYSDGARVLQSAHLFGTLPAGSGPSSEVQLVDLGGGFPNNPIRRNRLELWTRDGAQTPSAFGGFGVKIDLFVPYRPDAHIVLAFENDSVSLTQSAIPTGFRLDVRR